ncbi:MAG: hypothetical protein AB4080_00110 [Trichodesmium sp.]
MTPDKSESLAPVIRIAGLTLIATVVYVGLGVASLVDRTAVLDVSPETATEEQVEEQFSARTNSN